MLGVLSYTSATSYSKDLVFQIHSSLVSWSIRYGIGEEGVYVKS